MEEVVKGVFETNFGTAYEVYKDAIKIDSSIRLKDVKGYLNSRQDKQTHFKYKKYNNFVSPGANVEYEIDIMDVLARDGGDGIRYGLRAIGNFAKMVSVTPIKNRSPSEIIRGLKLIFGELGKPKQLYSDEESSLRGTEFFRFMNEKNIKTIQTSTHAHTVERFIYTSKMNLQRRLDALNELKSEWVKHVKNSVGKYNNTTHSIIEIKHNDAKLPQNHLWVSLHLWNSAKRDRPYEEIKKGDMVRIMMKKNKFDKARMPNWSSEKCKVIGIDNNNFLLNHPTRRKVFLRHEIRK